eukprot:TRINITY_DN214_c0_g1_i1.p1 TRINITY_DN214_c0_g1~~TRINITY_DN214_c0_g1_i1.p1  ORF type:complete len:338 (+),score=141.57 TRINITY_DN214_c0_g1_i1:40-1053(+)
METFSIVEEAFVYRAGQRTSSEGYKANEWDLNNPLWTGRVIVQGDGTICIIKLENTSGVLFAECRFDASKEGPTYVEKVTDSSRYFVLRIENKGRHAFIGLGFNERNSALTFYDGVIEHKKSLERKGELEKIKTERMNQPKVDRSFGDGQTITISFKTKTKQKEGSKKKNNKKNVVQLGNGGLLMPPPGDGPVQQRPNSNTNNLLFGLDTPTPTTNNNNNNQQSQNQNTNNLLFGNTTPPSSNNNTTNLLFGNTTPPPNNQNTNNLLFGNTTTHTPPNTNPTTNLLFGNTTPPPNNQNTNNQYQSYHHQPFVGKFPSPFHSFCWKQHSFVGLEHQHW